MFHGPCGLLSALTVDSDTSRCSCLRDKETPPLLLSHTHTDTEATKSMTNKACVCVCAAVYLTVCTCARQCAHLQTQACEHVCVCVCPSRLGCMRVYDTALLPHRQMPARTNVSVLCANASQDKGEGQLALWGCGVRQLVGFPLTRRTY